MTATMPVLQGGKNPDGIMRYRETVGFDDFMLIVASWVDNYPLGLREAATVFRRTIDAL